MRKTKIVCTIGPATNSEARLGELLDAGMNVARLNFSHGTHASHLQTIERIRKVSARKGVSVAILQDLAGPKIRVGEIDPEPVILEAGKPYVLTAEQGVGDVHRVSMNYTALPQEVQPGDQILLADGAIELRVHAIKGKDIVCDVVVGGELSSHKGINVPDRSLSVAALTEKDKVDLAFGLEHDVDYVAMSFVRRKEDIEQIQQIMEKKNCRVPIIAKVEKHEALDNMEDIIATADGIMVARGDLAVETALEQVPLAQKRLIRACNEACKPVITATQMLKSMVDSPRPTRAEANDVANAVLDGTDAVMLSEETTIGHYPIEAVRTMVRIICVAESCDLTNMQRRETGDPAISIQRAVSHAAFEMAQDLQASAILTPTQSGSTARMISSYRPPHPIIALSPEEKTVRQLCLIWGVHPILSDGYMRSDEIIEEAKDKALKSGLLKFGDTVVITAGVPIGMAGTTNLIKAAVLR